MRQPVSSFFKGPLLHTPQGIVVLACSAAYLLSALAVGVFELQPPFGWSSARFLSLSLGWPVLLLVFFIKNGQPSFRPSWPGAAWLAMCAVLPFVFVVFGLWRT